MKQIVFAIVFFLYGLTLYGQYRVSGVVKDSSGVSLPGATVMLKKSYYALSAGTGGLFSFSQVKEGQYTLYVSFMGYESYEKLIDVKEDMDIEVILKQGSIMADEVIVSASMLKSDMPLAFTSIKKDDIEMRNLGKDIPFLLNLTPSLVMTSDAGTGVGYSSFRIRGSDMNRINICLNGIPMNDAESHGTWFVDMPDLASSVEQIQVQRGVGTSTNGAGAFGASINLQSSGLRKKAYAELGSSFGSFNTFKNSILLGTGLINESFSFDARFSKLYSDGYIDRAFSDLFSYMLVASWYGSEDMIKLVHISGREKTYQAWDGVPAELLDTNRTWNGMGAYLDADGILSFYDNETDNYKQDHFQAFYSHESGNGILFNLALHYTRGKGYYEQYKDSEKLADYGFEEIVIGDSILSRVDMVRQKWLDNHFYGFTSSLSYKGESMDLIAGMGWNRYMGDHYGKVIWSEVAMKGDKDRQWYFNDGLKLDRNLYVKLFYRPSSAMSLFADMQLRSIAYRMRGADDDLRDITQDHDQLFFNPKLGINYSFNEKNKAFFSFAVANREPNRANYKDADPAEPVPVPERLYDYELAYNYYSGNVSLDLNAFYMAYKDQLVHTGEINDVGGPVMTNIPVSYRRGLEIIGSVLIAPPVRWEFNVSFSQNKIKNLTVLVDDWDTWSQREENKGDSDLSFSPPLVASGNISIVLPKDLHLNLISKYVSKQYIDNTANDDRSLHAYFLNDIVIKYSISPNLFREIGIQLMINNIFNVKYESNAWIYRYYQGGSEQSMSGYFPQAGTSFSVGLSMKF